MNRAEFMRSLAELLADVPLSEREEALQYYNDYFDDAGEENEQSVIASLGTPQQLAGTIKAGLADGGNMGEFTERGFSEYERKSNNEVMKLNHTEEENGGSSADNQDMYNGQSGYNSHNGYNSQSGYNNQNGYNSQSGYNGSSNYNGQDSTAVKTHKKQMSAGNIVIIVILCILASPLIIGLAGGLFGGVVGLFGGLIGILVGLGAAAIALIAVGVCLFVYGIVIMIGMPFGGLCLIGAALVCVAIGLVFLWLTVLVCGGLIPAVCKVIAKLFRSIFGKRGEKA